MRFRTAILFFAFVSFSFCSFAQDVSIVISADLRPYLEVVEGYRDSCGKNFRVFRVDNVDEESLRDSRVVVALGVSAFNLIKNVKIDAFKVYSLLIYPVKDGEFSCGLYLHPDPAAILDFFSKRKIKKVAVFYSVSDSRDYVFKAVRKAKKRGIVILPVDLKKYSLEEAISEVAGKVSLLWIIPDPAVASESVVSFIIKQALSYGIPVMGYNSFFCEEGALFCLSINYFETGRKLCFMVRDLLRRGICEDSSASFEIEVNRDAYKYFYGRTDDGKE